VYQTTNGFVPDDMKKITYLSIIIFSFLTLAVKAQNVDSLQKQLDTAQNVCVKLDLYTNIASGLIQFDQTKTHDVTNAEAAKAVDYVLKAIHINAKNNDTLALRTNFDMLGQAYFIQQKYTEAKWFILQSNAISRDMRDIPHIIYSLQQMATVKSAIKDFSLAAKYTYNLPKQIEVERSLAIVYDNAGDVKAAIATQKHYSLLADNLKKAQTPKVVAMQSVKTKTKAGHTLADIKPAVAGGSEEQPVETRLNIQNGVWAMNN
jgi:hypothetical protein